MSASPYPYVMTTGKFKTFLKKITEIGVPETVNAKYLKGLGFTSSNDPRFLNVLDFIEFTQNKTPTDLWRLHRTNQGLALAKGITQGYRDLYSQYPEAHKKDAETLHAFFAANTDHSKDTVNYIVNTFKMLCEDASFSALENVDDDYQADEVPERASKQGAKAKVYVNSGADPVTVNINISLTLSADATKDHFDDFFTSMRKNLVQPDE